MFKSWNVAFVNVFLLRFIVCPIGSDWYLVVFWTIHWSFLMFSWFVLCSLLGLLFPYFAVGLLLSDAISAFFECVGCCSGSFKDGLFFVSFMLELHFRSCALPFEVALFVVSVFLLGFGLWMKLILMVTFPCYLYWKL